MKLEIISIEKSRLSQMYIWNIKTSVNTDMVNFVYSYTMNINNEAISQTLNYSYDITLWSAKEELLPIQELMESWLNGNEAILKHLDTGYIIDLDNPPLNKIELPKAKTYDAKTSLKNRNNLRKYLNKRKLP